MEPFEPPKYITSLIAAINDGAKSAQLGALAFVAVGVFLLASTFSASDEDLLLNHSVAISQLGGISMLGGLSLEKPGLPALLERLPPSTPRSAVQQLTERLEQTARSGDFPFEQSSTKRGLVLLDTPCEGASFLGIACERTRSDRTEHWNDVIPIWVGEIARAYPPAAEQIATRVDMDDNIDDPAHLRARLACRMIAEAQVGSVQLKPNTIKRLKDFAGVGCQPPAQAK